MRRRAPPKPSRPNAGPPAAGRAPEPLLSPAFAIAALLAAAAVLFAVTFRFFDYDLWEHLVVGKFLWTERRIPTTQLWTWPTWGEPALVPSWAFRALLWPFWSLGGETGLALWRWLTALAAFALLFVAARRRGADPYVTLAILALCAIPWRGRTRVRPETLVFVLLAAQLVLLAVRDRGKAWRDAGLVAIAWLWIQTHATFVIGWAILLFHLPGQRSREERRRGLLVLAASVAVSFLHPHGWRAVAQPFDVLLRGRSEPIYAMVTELGGVDLVLDLRNGLVPLLVAWPALLLWRARRRGLDVTETLTCALLGAQTLFAQRFRGFYVLACAVWISRDLTEELAALRASPLAWPAARRAALAGAAIAACVAWMRWGQPELRPGFGLDMAYVPVRACDFIAAEGVRGRAFNSFWYGGYMEWRFWPDRGRLPFMDGHLESGDPRDRTLYARAQDDHAAWETLDREKDFDFALLDLRAPVGLPLREFIESDSTWSAVFVDDAAALFVRRRGALAAVAERHGYRRLRVGPAALEALMTRCTSDPALRAEVRRELERQAAGSPWTSVAHELLAAIAEMDGRGVDAAEHRERARAARPGLGAR